MRYQRNKRVEVEVVADANGNAVAVTPNVNGPAWQLTQVTVSSTSTLLSQCATYVGANSAGVRISSTYLGNGDTDSSPNTTLKYGESVCAVWSNVTPGSACRLTVVFDETGY